jgi:hypothetical protein
LSEDLERLSDHVNRQLNIVTAFSFVCGCISGYHIDNFINGADKKSTRQQQIENETKDLFIELQRETIKQYDKLSEVQIRVIRSIDKIGTPGTVTESQSQSTKTAGGRSKGQAGDNAIDNERIGTWFWR